MKKIKAYNSSGDYINCITQWDKNQVIYVDDLESGTLPSVQYSPTGYHEDACFGFQSTVSISGGKVRISIPDEMMRYSGKLYLFLLYNNTTKYVVELTVHRKPKPEDYEIFASEDELRVALRTYFSDVQTLLRQIEYTTESNNQTTVITDAQKIVSLLNK